MSSDNGKSQAGDPAFIFADRELQRLESDKERAQRRRLQRELAELAVERASKESKGFDPYNSTGGFDRSKLWTRVGKR